MRDGAQPLGRVVRAPPGPGITTNISAPDQLVCLDHADMPKDKEGYDTVQVMSDAWSHDCSLVALKGTSAEESADALFAGWISHKGLFEQLHTDGAKALHGGAESLIRVLCKKMKVEKSVITPGNPSGNSPAENLVHRTKLVLKNLAHKFPRMWRKFLPIVQYALKMSHHECLL